MAAPKKSWTSPAIAPVKLSAAELKALFPTLSDADVDRIAQRAKAA